MLYESSHSPPTIEFLNCSDNGFSLRSSLGKFHSLLKNGIGNINSRFHGSIIPQSSIHFHLYWNIPIRAAARVIASPQVAPTQLKRAQTIIERQVTHMALLLDDLLDVARGSLRENCSSRKQRSGSSTSLMPQSKRSRPALNAKHHELSLNLPANPLLLHADSLRLSQVLSNLLMNAAKYSDSGGHIEVAGNVEDDGIGIAPESIAGIFEMFSQIESATGKSDGGLGIGLALVKGLTELHGGTVEARSGGLGFGSEFIVRLPLARRDPVAPSDVTEAAPAPPVRRRILIADDNQPDLSGYELAQNLRREPWAAKIRLIAHRSREAGWIDFQDVYGTVISSTMPQATLCQLAQPVDYNRGGIPRRLATPRHRCGRRRNRITVLARASSC